MQVTVTLEHYWELRRELEQMPDKGKSVLSRATKEGAVYLSNKIRPRVGRSTKTKSVHLRDAIRVRKARLRKPTKQAHDIIGRRGRQVDYGFHAECGTEHTDAKKFMRNTTDNNNEKVANIIMDEIERALGV